MKNIRITIFLLICWSTGSAQNTFPTPSGNVGIGTAQPQIDLDIRHNSVGGITLKRSSMSNLIGKGLYITGGGHASDNDWGGISAGVFHDLGTYTARSDAASAVEFKNGNIFFKAIDGLTDGTFQISFPSRLTIRPNGNIEIPGNLNVTTNVGIGTSTPQTDLEVYEYSGTSHLRVHTNQHAGIAKIELAGGSAFLDSNPDNYSGWSIYHSYVNTGKDLYFRHGESGNPNFVLTDNGNVGIGINNPDSKLVVDGKIRSEEVKVEIINGPDYVFKSDYELRTLQETKEYITTNKHLPEIPSAKEMEANGIDLGDMNMKLLKKIEELTLHQIELLERLEKAEGKISKLENK